MVELEAKDGASPTAPARGPARLAHWGRLQVDARTTAANRWIGDRRDSNVLVDVGCRIDERDRAAAGSVTGRAVAFRLFLFFVPFLLFLVGILGFLAAPGQWVWIRSRVRINPPSGSLRTHWAITTG